MLLATLAAVMAICLLCAPLCLAKGAPDAINYIKARQGTDGGFAEPDAASDGTTTCWAMFAGASAGEQVTCCLVAKRKGERAADSDR